MNTTYILCMYQYLVLFVTLLQYFMGDFVLKFYTFKSMCIAISQLIIYKIQAVIYK